MADELRPRSKDLRERFEREHALPLASALFELEPRCQSVLVTVGQYWCDEAADAVHCEMFACAEREPTWPEAAQPGPTAIGDEESLAEARAPRDEGEEVWDIVSAQSSLQSAASEKAFGTEFFSVLDDNTDMIVAFASYCREESSQEEPLWRSHTPYALVRRPPAGEAPKLQVIGQMYRPDWEDRWDVLESEMMDEEAPAVSEVATPTSRARLPLPASKQERQAAARATAWPSRVLLLLLLASVLLGVRACLQA